MYDTNFTANEVKNVIILSEGNKISKKIFKIAIVKIKTLYMDAIDKKILEILQNDAMKTAKEMASKLALSTTPIYERIRKLEQAGIIKQYVALLDAELLGKNIIVFLNMTLKDQNATKRNEFILLMKETPAVNEIYYTSGKYDFIVKARFSTIQEYRNFLVNELPLQDIIGHIDGHLVLEEIKYSTRIPMDT